MKLNNLENTYINTFKITIMKANKIFMAFLAAGMFVGCTNDETETFLNTPQSNKIETSYLNVHVNSVYTPGTRASDGGFAEGTPEEQKITTAHFFFFNNSGGAFNVNAESLDAKDTPNVNYLVRQVTDNGDSESPNVESLTDAVLAIKNNKGEIPAYLVAVLNWDYDGASISLSDLKTTLVEEANFQGVNGFVMSNSVYAKGSNVVDATPITAANIASSETEALSLGKPVEVYVERVAAKVALTQTGDKYDTGVANPGSSGGNIYAVVQGWDLNTTISHSNLVKTIDTSWDNGTLGFMWNDEPYFRSYWAESVATNGTVTLKKNFNWSNLANAVGSADYCLENTSDVTGDNTKALVAVKFVDASDAPVTVAKLFADMMTVEGLKNSIANSLASSYYYDNAGTKVSIAPEHIELVAAGSAGHDSYKVTYKLTTAAEALTWFVKDGATYNASSATDVNAKLSVLEKAQVWNGMGYYIVDIEHLGTKNINGVVRNHTYAINVDDIKGLGTPVYDGDNDVEEPIRPEDSEAFIAAQIKVLSWKLVNQNVTLQ